MNDVVKYLQECGTFFLATVEGDQPHVRPFGAVCEFEGKLYIVTNNKKDVYNQMKVNGKVEMCGMNKGTWIRVKGAVKEDTRREARVAMMEANKNALQSTTICLWLISLTASKELSILLLKLYNDGAIGISSSNLGLRVRKLD